MADLYKYKFTYYYGEGSGDFYNGYLYAEEGSYTVDQLISMEDGGRYFITEMSQVEEDDDASAGEVYISSYYDQDGSGAPYVPDYYELELAAGTEGLGSESDWIFDTEFGYVTNGDTTEVIAVDVENAGAQIKVIATVPFSAGQGDAFNFTPDDNWEITDNDFEGGWETAIQYFPGEVVIEFADDPYTINDEDRFDFLTRFLPAYESFLEGEDFDYESFNYFDLFEPLIEAEVFAPGDEVYIIELPDNATQGFSQSYYIVDEGAGSVTLELGAENEITETVLIIRNNDWGNDFSNAFSIEEYAINDFWYLDNITISSSNIGADKQLGELNHGGNDGGASVWYSWTAIESQPISISADMFIEDEDSNRTALPEVLAVYTGSDFNDLTEVGSSVAIQPEFASAVLFNAVAGTTYYIAVDSYNDGGELQTGDIDLEVEAINESESFYNYEDQTINDLTTVTSDIYINGVPETIADVDVNLNINHTWDADLDVFLISPEGTRVELFTDIGGSGDNFSFTRLDDEAATAITDGEAPFSGTFSPEGLLADFDGENPNGVWTLEITDDAGNDVGTLTQWSLDFDFVLEEADYTNIPNDNFADAVDLNEMEALVSADNFDASNPFYFVWESNNTNATKETGEPNHGNDSGGASVWYSWTAPESGIISISTEGSDFDTTLGVYTGYVVDNLTTVASNDDVNYSNNILTSEVAVEVVAGQTYYIGVDGYEGATGNIDLAINPVEVTFANYTGWIIEDEATFNAEIVVDYFFEDQITDVNVELILDHSYHEDLEVFLVKLDSFGEEEERVELFSDIGGRGDGFTTITLDDEAVDPITGATSLEGIYQPVDSLGDLDGQDANGTWLLEVTDDAGDDVGFLYNWSITFGFNEESDTVTLSPATDFTTVVEPIPTIDFITPIIELI